MRQRYARLAMTKIHGEIKVSLQAEQTRRTYIYGNKTDVKNKIQPCLRDLVLVFSSVWERDHGNHGNDIITHAQ